MKKVGRPLYDAELGDAELFARLPCLEFAARRPALITGLIRLSPRRRAPNTARCGIYPRTTRRRIHVRRGRWSRCGSLAGCWNIRRVAICGGSPICPCRAGLTATNTAAGRGKVRQFDFGHVSVKKTWLYIVGVEPDKVLPMIKPRKKGRSVKIWWMPSRRVMEEAKKTGRLPNGMKWRPEEWDFKHTGKNRQYLLLAYPPDFAGFLINIAAQARVH